MTSRAKTALLALSLISILAAPFAEAARLGKGRSAGMQRSTPTQSYQQPSAAPAQPAAPMAPAAAGQQKGSGIGGMLAAGAVGAAAGYMLSSAFGGDGDFPWLGILAGGLGGLALLSFLRNRAARQRQQAPRPMSVPTASRFEPATAGPNGAIPPIGSGMQPQGGSGLTPPPASLQRLPDGTEIPHFLRQAKATFLHLQNLNSAESLEEVRKYMTPELFNALRDDISSNSEAADFPQLDCTVIEAVNEGGRMIASVRFSGTVSESVGTAAVPFSEVWHYVKDDSNSAKWLIAGIQQA
ncbi:Tim44 domain-containing protein [Vogesella indigofera]|uniref:Tim44 domain-containing protein n=1 Tax=Vogesella indigofera TaxID=45465 RepID=UPI003F41E4BA